MGEGSCEEEGEGGTHHRAPPRSLLLLRLAGRRRGFRRHDARPRITLRAARVLSRSRKERARRRVQARARVRGRGRT